VIKIRLILLLVSLAALNSCQELVSPDLSNKSSKVKSETKWIVDISTNRKISKIHLIEYDINGKVILNEEYNQIGNLYSRSEYSHILGESKEKLKIYGDSGNIVNQSEIIYNYDLDGRITKKISYNDSGLVISVSNFSYDKNGNVLTKIEENGNVGTQKTDFAYSYNNTGNLVERVTLNEGSAQSRDSLVYEPNKQELKIFNFNKDNLIISCEVMKYNNDGLVLEQLVYDNNKILIKKYIYDYTFHF